MGGPAYILVLFLSGYWITVVNGSFHTAYGSGHPTLYYVGDGVHQFVTDSALQSHVFRSNNIWLVQFYSHWCGHCQRFAPIWKKVGKKFENWSDLVKIAAINCADSSITICRKFNIQGTPTVRVFRPHSVEGEMGIDLQVKSELDHWYFGILKEVDLYQRRANDTTSYPNIPQVSSFSAGKSRMKDMKTDVRGKSYIISILEAPSDETGYGRLAVLELSQRFPRSIVVNRVAYENIDEFLKAYAPTLTKSSLHLPLLFIGVAHGGRTLEAKQYRIDSTSYLGEKNYGDLLHSIMKLRKTITRDLNLDGSTVGSTTIPSVTEGSSVEIIDIYDDEAPYRTGAIDLDQALVYSLTEEIPLQTRFNKAKFQSLYDWISAIVKYLPLKPETMEWMIRIRKELFAWADPHGITGNHFAAMVGRLRANMGGLQNIESKWVGCKGSQANYRGYPCSLWQTFHTLTVYSYKKDPLDTRNGVAFVIFNYVKEFFTCRECAENFMKEVKSNGNLPVRPRETVLWLWDIHNKANLRLHGDPTEDPEHPKTFWPSREDCPDCYNSFGYPDIGEIDVDRDSVLRHILETYEKADMLETDPKIFLKTECEGVKEVNLHEAANMTEEGLKGTLLNLLLPDDTLNHTAVNLLDLIEVDDVRQFCQAFEGSIR